MTVINHLDIGTPTRQTRHIAGNSAMRFCSRTDVADQALPHFRDAPFSWSGVDGFLRGRRFREVRRSANRSRPITNFAVDDRSTIRTLTMSDNAFGADELRPFKFTIHQPHYAISEDDEYQLRELLNSLHTIGDLAEGSPGDALADVAPDAFGPIFRSFARLGSRIMEGAEIVRPNQGPILRAVPSSPEERTHDAH
jgi:hypothetical protein